MNDNLLKPVADGLPLRENKEHGINKLLVIDGYINRFITSMRNRGWRELYYIDLFAGPGKNIFPKDVVTLGSPLVALTARHSFTKYRFVEFDPKNCEALRTRADESEHRENVVVLQGDCNYAVDDIVREISNSDKVFVPGLWSSLCLAVLDPEGLELHWETVEKLGNMKRMDLIINFSTSGITRNANKLLKTGNTSSIDRFFGTTEWQSAYIKSAGDSTRIRRNLLDLYKQRLGMLGYQVVEPDPSDELVFKNSKNVQLYTLLGASKHERGVEFWQDTIAGKSSSGQISMF